MELKNLITEIEEKEKIWKEYAERHSIAWQNHLHRCKEIEREAAGKRAISFEEVKAVNETCPLSYSIITDLYRELEFLSHCKRN